VLLRWFLFACVAAFALGLQSEARADPIADCAVVMGKEVPGDSNAELRAGCTCQLAFLKAHLAAPEYVFWTQQLAIMGNKTMEDAERNQLMLRLLSQRGVGPMMTRIANAAQAALDPCRLETWKKSR
jgi:hypothetical protein